MFSDVRIAEEAKAAKADRPTRQALIERAPAVPAPTPKPEVKVSDLGGGHFLGLSAWQTIICY